MNLLDSLKVIFLLQSIFRLSLLTPNKQNNAISISRSSLIISTCITILSIFWTATVIAWNNDFYFHHPDLRAFNPVDTSSLTTFISFLPIPTSIGSVAAVFTTNFFVTSAEMKFFETLGLMDVVLKNYINLDLGYPKTLKRAKTLLIALIVFTMFEWVLPVSFTFSYSFRNDHTKDKYTESDFEQQVVILSTRLPPPKLFRVNMLTMFASTVIMYLANVRYMLAVNEIVWRAETLCERLQDNRNENCDGKDRSELLRLRRYFVQVMLCYTY